MYCIETTNLTHAYSEKEYVLNNISIKVPQGSIYGFLGPNGAGKTTTLRLILGLVKKQTGSITIFGKSLEKNRISILQNIGSLIESPSIYGHLTATENLAVLQKIHQCPKERIQEVLTLVGLSNTGKKLAGKFSLGMKQRLSIAIALLNNPELLVLDEPTNGLDPNGIIEMRELLKRINQERKITILISSHLLSEIEKLVTHVGIINKGNLLFQGTLSDLLNKQKLSSFVRFETNDNDKALTIIKEFQTMALLENEKIKMSIISKELIAQITKKLIQSNVDIYEITVINDDLETIFMDLIK